MAFRQRRDTRRQEIKDGQSAAGPSGHGIGHNNSCAFASGDISRNLEAQECGRFYENMRAVVWILEVSGVEVHTHGAAFCIDPEGYLLTSAHNFPKCYQTFVIRKFDDRGFRLSRTGEVKLIAQETRFDLVLLKVERNKVGDEKGFKYALFAEDGSLICGQHVLQIGHPSDWYFTLVRGEVCYPCVDLVTVEECPDAEIVGELDVNDDFESFSVTQPYRRARDMIRPDDDELNGLHPNAQLIQINNFHGSHGSFGSPVFNNMGHIVGLTCSTKRSMDLAIHVSMLKQFALPYIEEDKRKKPRKEIQKGSMKMKGKRKVEDRSKKR